jgi:hypothetical protein
MPYIPSSSYESRAADDSQPATSFINARSRHPAPHAVTETEITEYVTPTQGTAESTVSLQLRTNYDLQAEQYTFILMFGNKKCIASLQKFEYEDEWYNYLLNVEVPPFHLTNAWDPTMMLKLQLEDKNGHLRHQADAGRFTFTDMSPNLAYQSTSPDFSRKRKYSTEFGEVQDYDSSKRANPLRFQTKPRSLSGAYSAAQLSPLAAQSPLSQTYSPYDISKHTAYGSHLSQKGLYAIPSMAQADLKPPHMSPSMQSYNQYGSLPHAGRSPASIAATPSTMSVLPSPSTLPAPVLVRATTIPQAGGASNGQPFNPYSMYQTKAVLKIDGDLDKMAEDWTQEEMDAKRRLVHFERSQHGSTISTTFAPIAPEVRPARSICVSCIWWEEKDEYFITSVDTIYLLEQLVNVRFTVEEKNRIRRNLEGFRPLTVSKAKPDSEEFFKVIMGFPNPKPRNIEKDVKVFAWKILSHALKKIISKYVCTPPDVAQPTLTPAVRKLLFDRGDRFLAHRIDIELYPRRARAGVRQHASQHVATVGFSVGCLGRLHSQHDLNELIAEFQTISRPRRISRPRHADAPARPLGAEHVSMGAWCASNVAVPSRHRTERADLGLHPRLSQCSQRKCSCGRRRTCSVASPPPTVRRSA